MSDKFKDIRLDLLIDAVLSLKDEDECRRFFDDLCTVQELRALCQRLHVAQMLAQKKVYNEIVAETGASTATISRVNRSLNYGCDGYRTAFTRMKERAEQE